MLLPKTKNWGCPTIIVGQPLVIGKRMTSGILKAHKTREGVFIDP